MTRADAEAEIRNIARVCRGPRRTEITPRDYARMGAELQDALASCPAPEASTDAVGHYIAALLAESLKRQAGDLDEQMRQGCGMDFNNIVAAGPFDGEAHAYECPSCHVTGIYQAPFYAVEG